LSRGIADTSVFIARESGRPIAENDLPDELAISVITIGELRSGVLAAVDVETRDRRLATLSEALALDPLPVDQTVAEAWARLRVLLRDMQKRIPVNDSWIAATAMSLGVPVVTKTRITLRCPGSRFSEFELPRDVHENAVASEARRRGSATWLCRAFRGTGESIVPSCLSDIMMA